MEIVTQQLGDVLEVKVRGRLDNYWTEHLRRNLEEVIRGGAHGIQLNLSEIGFLSSAGVGLLVSYPAKKHRRKFRSYQPLVTGKAGIGSLPSFHRLAFREGRDCGSATKE